MQLVLFSNSPVPLEQIGHIVKVLVFQRKHRPADDVHIVFDGQLWKEIEVLRGEFGELSHRKPGSLGFDEWKQLQGEQFGKQDEIALVIGGNIDKIFRLSGKVRKALDFPHLILNHANTNRLRRDIRSVGIGGIIEIRPLEQCCVP